jgi:carboxyl-terminal processing protease
MKFLKALILTISISFLTTGCFEDNDDTAIGSSSINDFVWKGMNSWYNWQSEVPNLADTKKDNTNDYQSYLNQFIDPSDLFYSLLFEDGITDRFSWFVDDYIALQQQFQGISKSFGMRYEAVQINSSGDVIIYVTYVSNNSPASNANIKRGDIFNAIDGNVLTTSNFNNIAGRLSNETVKLSFVSTNGGSLAFLEDKTITSNIISDNPIYLTKIFNDINGKKVGYLVYTGFRSSYNDELNAAFATFKSQNIDELILDLRLNGGGSVETSAYLSSMIYANAALGTFAELNFNSKHQNQNGSYNFSNTLNVYSSNDVKTGEEPINRLNSINKLYVLTSDNTASASEMVINGLKPYMEVKLVGTTTYGKNVGSITLYDSPQSDFQDRSSANPSHTKAMQPIVFQIFNKNGESDYTQGFIPNIEIKEFDYWDTILPFGDENEVVLKAALDDIRGITTKISNTKKTGAIKSLKSTSFTNKFEQEMYK